LTIKKDEYVVIGSGGLKVPKCYFKMNYSPGLITWAFFLFSPIKIIILINLTHINNGK